MTAGWAAVRAISHQFPGGSVYVLGMPSVVEMARRAGLTPVGEESDGPTPDAILVGLDRGLTYARLRRGTRALVAGAAFFAVNRDHLLPMEDGVDPGTGSIVAALEYSTGKTATSIGKPEPGIALEAMRILGVGPEDTLMIGDALTLDIVAGHRAGATTGLMLTGLSNRAQAESAVDESRPDYVFEDMFALLNAASHPDDVAGSNA